MPKASWSGKLERIDPWRWRIPRSHQRGMRTDGIVYASAEMMKAIQRDNALQQVANVACLPGIVGNSLAMPDIHYGYGFPIGGVAATAVEGGVVSPGGVGYDINCGVRLLRTDLTRDEVEPKIRDIVDQIFVDVPSGVGSKGKVRVDQRELKRVLVQGARWAVSQGMGWSEDPDHIEDGGCIQGADPDALSPRAIERGRPQLGTLGAGNHFLEVQVVDEIFDAEAARALGIAEPGQITVMIHTGSRGLGYQVCDDALRDFRPVPAKYGISLPDRQLACAPIESPEGRRYLGEMRAAANYAYANRHILGSACRTAFRKALGIPADELGLRLVYDVAHNLARLERSGAGREAKILCVHRKGATRALPPGDERLPEVYREIGQPVIVPGDMGRYSFVLCGVRGGAPETFDSVCHGAGRRMSRSAARRAVRFGELREEMERRGVVMMARGKRTAVEEAPEAYKDVGEVVDVVARAGLAAKVARLRPLAVIKG